MRKREKKKTATVYGSNTGTAEIVAGEIHQRVTRAYPKDISGGTSEELEQYGRLNCGAESQW